MKHTPDSIRGLPTLCVAQCCSLKIETDTKRVWLCRVGGGVSVETYNGRNWRVSSGGCNSREADDNDARRY